MLQWPEWAHELACDDQEHDAEDRSPDMRRVVDVSPSFFCEIGRHDQVQWPEDKGGDMQELDRKYSHSHFRIEKDPDENYC